MPTHPLGKKSTRPGYFIPSFVSTRRARIRPWRVYAANLETHVTHSVRVDHADTKVEAISIARATLIDLGITRFTIHTVKEVSG